VQRSTVNMLSIANAIRNSLSIDEFDTFESNESIETTSRPKSIGHLAPPPSYEQTIRNKLTGNCSAQFEALCAETLNFDFEPIDDDSNEWCDWTPEQQQSLSAWPCTSVSTNSEDSNQSNCSTKIDCGSSISVRSSVTNTDLDLGTPPSFNSPVLCSTPCTPQYAAPPNSSVSCPYPACSFISPPPSNASFASNWVTPYNQTVSGAYSSMPVSPCCYPTQFMYPSPNSYPSPMSNQFLKPYPMLCMPNQTAFPLSLSQPMSQPPPYPAPPQDTPTESYPCSHCDRVFINYRTLRRHQNKHAVATNLPFQCLECPATYKGNTAFKRHVRLNHQNQRSYQCPLCDNRFADGQMLKDHFRVHTGQKSYSCAVCSRPFRQQITMERHMKRHHSS
jgi:DNA-directed RNA polymerase subunit RPC12/RpoP